MKIISGPEWSPLQVQEGKADRDRLQSLEKELEEFTRDEVYISTENHTGENFRRLQFRNLYVYVNDSSWDKFNKKFRYYIDGDRLNYDNLINLLIMVKNAGDGFRDILTRNLPYVDRWTFLDTGSTDNTIEIIKDVMKNKRGRLYEEPFINFRESRNRLLELAGDSCAFNIMLDDTYVIEGDLRTFLTFARGDDVIDSYSLVIEDIDTLYNSNRITKPSRKLKYVNIIHEIIETNLNVAVPYKTAKIIDVNSKYMANRTRERKLDDIKLLEETLENDPSDPRSYYYLGDSYLGLKDWKKALYYFNERTKHEGNVGEIQDSMYYIAVLSHFHINEPWEKCHELYLKCYNFEPKRVEALYFIGKHYIESGMRNVGFMYLKKAFDSGLPDIQMSYRKKIYHFHIPRDLLLICYDLKECKLGEECCRRILDYYPENTTIKNWLNIFTVANACEPFGPFSKNKEVLTEKLVCFVSPGGWDKWDGETYYTKGLGGSETFTVKYSETLARLGYNVFVFCKCEDVKDYNGVKYLPVQRFNRFICTYKVDACFINRYPEYVPTALFAGVENVYLILHDLISNDTILPIEPNFKGVLCISEWHRQFFLNMFPGFKDRAKVISYGIDHTLYKGPEKGIKLGYTFIYPSFPNRGLLPLLQMFPRIVEKYPGSKLHVFCDMENEWTVQHHKEVLDQIKVLLDRQKENVTNHGWVNGETLRKFWDKADVWLYPCTFQETCCLTAYEAAASKTLVVSNNMAALTESIGDRGVIVKGDCMSIEWQNTALEKMFKLLDDMDESEYIEKNYEWVKTKDFRTVVQNFAKKYI